MPIIKSLPWRKVSRDEAMANHFENATPEELAALRTNGWKAAKFARKFQEFGLSRYLSLRNSATPYEEAAHHIADNIQAVGQTACGAGCGLRVFYRTEFPGQIVTYTQPRCQKDGCPEIGLIAAETEQQLLPARAAVVLSQFDNSAPQISGL